MLGYYKKICSGVNHKEFSYKCAHKTKGYVKYVSDTFTCEECNMTLVKVLDHYKRLESDENYRDVNEQIIGLAKFSDEKYTLLV